MILILKSAKFHPPGTLPEFPKALPELLQTLPKLSQAPPEPRLGQIGAREGFGSILERSRALKYDKNQLIGDFWNTHTVGTGGGEVVARSAARSPSPHAPEPG